MTSRTSCRSCTSSRARPIARGGAQRHCSGHTLIELTIATALGLLVVAMVVSLYRAARQFHAASADTAQMREAGTTALWLLSEQIQMAGFVPPAVPALSAEVAPGLFGCASGYPVETETGLRCKGDMNGSDGLAIRYVDDAVATWPTEAGQTTDCLGQGVGRAGEPVVVSNQFFVATPREGGAPELYCQGNGGLARQPAVAGVERLTLRYWIRGAKRPVRADAVAPNAWRDVVAVDICVRVRGTRAAARGQYADCDSAAPRHWDGRARQVFRRRVAVRNHEQAGR